MSVSERALRVAEQGAALRLQIVAALCGLPREEGAADGAADGVVGLPRLVEDCSRGGHQRIREEDGAQREDAQPTEEKARGQRDQGDGRRGQEERGARGHRGVGVLTRRVPRGLIAGQPGLFCASRMLDSATAQGRAPKDRMSHWVLKFISGKYQGGEFPLEEGQDYYIGRSSESDMVLVEDMVSRQHARIVVRNGLAMLEDLGSTNGSFVNGERVANKTLEEGDRILFGTSIIKLIQVEEGAISSMGDEPSTDVKSIGLARPGFERPEEPSRQTMAMRPPTSTVSGMMSGLLEEVALPDLLQLFSTSRKSGVLRLHDEPERASVFLREGRVVYCEIAGQPMPPDKAAFRVMTWTKGMFVLEPPVDRTFEVEIEMSTEALMMESMRLMDEMENLRNQLPSLDTRVALRTPLEPPLRGLTPELLDTLQLAINANTVGDVLNTSAGTDLETLQDIDYLIKHGYLEQQ